MSCIPKILQIKGDENVFLPLGEDGKPWIAVEGGGSYRDHDYLIVLNRIGHRCGYVAIKPEHHFSNTPLEKRDIAGKEYDHYDYDSLNIECHGGLTFMGRNHGLKELLNYSCDDFWIGFDCGHCDDASDVMSVRKYYGNEEAESILKYMVSLHGGIVRDYDYVSDVCKHIIDQLIEIAA